MLVGWLFALVVLQSMRDETSKLASKQVIYARALIKRIFVAPDIRTVDVMNGWMGVEGGWAGR